MSLIENGYTILKNVLEDHTFIESINSALYKYLEIKNSTYNRTDNALHHLVVYDKWILLPLLQYLAALDEIKNYFSTEFIMHSCGAVINKPNRNVYTQNFHIDTYEPSNERLMLNILVPMCDFTIENGCTKLYPLGSDTPIDILLEKGDILLFNSSLLHCTGENKTTNDRNCLTITFIKAYLKPQFDYLSLYSENELQQLSDDHKQLINYYSRVPTRLEDFYARRNNVVK